MMPFVCTIRIPDFPEGFDHADRYRSYVALLTWKAQGVCAQGRAAPLERASVHAVLQRPRGQPALDNERAESCIRQLLGALDGVLVSGAITLSVAQQLGDKRNLTIEVTELVA